MGAELNTTKGRELVMLIRNQADTAWELLGGVTDAGSTFNNPTEATTSSSTEGDYEESEWTGYSQATMNISGSPDKRTGVDPITGLNRVKTTRLIWLATNGNRNGQFKFMSTDPDLPFDVSGWFNIPNFDLNRTQTSKAAFSATLESKEAVVVVTAE